jgi:cysteinyl-tRNA synthetase
VLPADILSCIPHNIRDRFAATAGHARVYVAFDMLYRLLSRVLRYNVQYVRNFTDVDDKIIARAAALEEDPLALAGRYIQEFHADMEALGCLPPTVRACVCAQHPPRLSLYCASLPCIPSVH